MDEKLWWEGVVAKGCGRKDHANFTEAARTTAEQRPSAVQATLQVCNRAMVHSESQRFTEHRPVSPVFCRLPFALNGFVAVVCGPLCPTATHATAVHSRAIQWWLTSSCG